MTTPFIIDAHMHIGPAAQWYSAQTDVSSLLSLMDRLGIQAGVCSDMLSVFEGAHVGLHKLSQVFEESQGRIFFLGVFNPNYPQKCLEILKEKVNSKGFAGIKIHPPVHGVSAEDKRYEPAWRFAAEHSVPILAHTWSVSDYNPVQKYSTPERFEEYVRSFPQVKLVLGHAGGRGSGRLEAVRMVNAYENVYLDFAGDIFCYELIEGLVATVPAEKILFGSDFPMMDPRANLSRVLLVDVDETVKRKILRDNAINVYGLTITEKRGK